MRKICIVTGSRAEWGLLSGLARKIADDPKDGEYAIDLLIIAKYYERIADHAVNIAKWVIFSVTGVHKEE